MATIPAPKTWVSVESVNVAALNTELRDALLFLLSPPFVVLARVATQSIPNLTSTAMDWDTETIDTDAGHDPATNRSRHTIKTPGYYFVSSLIDWAGNTAGKRQVGYRVNGATTYYADQTALSGAAVETIQSSGFVIPYAFVLNDYIEVMVNQSSGGSLNVSTLGQASYSARWMHT